MSGERSAYPSAVLTDCAMRNLTLLSISHRMNHVGTPEWHFSKITPYYAYSRGLKSPASLPAASESIGSPTVKIMAWSHRQHSKLRISYPFGTGMALTSIMSRAASCARRPPKISARWFIWIRMRVRHMLPLSRGNLYRRHDHWYMVHASGSEGTKIGVIKKQLILSSRIAEPLRAALFQHAARSLRGETCKRVPIASCSLPARFRGAGCRRIRAAVLSCKLVSSSETEHGQCAAQTSCAPSVFQNNTLGPSRNPIP
jgi:hypothetical protein